MNKNSARILKFEAAKFVPGGRRGNVRKITDELLRTAEFAPRAKPFEVWDQKYAGFLVRVNPSGVRSFIVQYGYGKRVTIGRVDDITTDKARGRAEAIKGAYRDRGIDPQAEKKAERERRKAERIVKREARKAEREQLKAERLKAAEEKRARQSLGQFIEENFARLASENKDKAREKERLKSTFASLMDEPVTSITSDHIIEWRDRRRTEGAAESSIHRSVPYLKMILRLAVKRSILKEDPFDGIKFKRLDRGEPRYLTDEEEARLYATLEARERKMRQRRDRFNEHRKERGKRPLRARRQEEYADHLLPLVTVAQHTGMRRGELFGLTWSAVNFNLKQVTVRAATAKSGKTRHIPLNERALAALVKWHQQSKRTEPTDLVFPGDRGRRLDNIQSSWDEVRKAAKLVTLGKDGKIVDGVRFHDLRHTFASRLVMVEVPLNTVRELMGHATMEMTLRYAHLAPKHLAEAVARIAK